MRHEGCCVFFVFFYPLGCNAQCTCTYVHTQFMTVHSSKALCTWIPFPSCFSRRVQRDWDHIPGPFCSPCWRFPHPLVLTSEQLAVSVWNLDDREEKKLDLKLLYHKRYLDVTSKWSLLTVNHSACKKNTVHPTSLHVGTHQCLYAYLENFVTASTYALYSVVPKVQRPLQSSLRLTNV